MTTRDISIVFFAGLLPLLFAPAIHSQEQSDSVTVPFTVNAYYRTDIMSRLDGYVGKIHFEVGDTVKKGDVLVELHAPEVLAAAKQKEKQIEKALAGEKAAAAELARVASKSTALKAQKSMRDSQLHRIGGLVRSGVVTRAKQDEATFAQASVVSEMVGMDADLKAAEANVVVALAEIEMARADRDYAAAMVDYLTIKAPFDGVVTQRNVDPGAYVRPASGVNASPIMRLEQIDKVRLIIMVPYASARSVSVGSKVVISGIRGRKNVQIQTEITRVAAGFEDGSRTMRVEVELENKANFDGQRVLRAGDYGSAEISLLPQNTAQQGAMLRKKRVDTQPTEIAVARRSAPSSTAQDEKSKKPVLRKSSVEFSRVPESGGR